MLFTLNHKFPNNGSTNVDADTDLLVSAPIFGENKTMGSTEQHIEHHAA